MSSQLGQPTTAEQRAAVAPLARAELARRRLGDFLALLVPSYERTPHTKLLCGHLEALERREITRLAVFLPPRHSKSEHASRGFPAWYLGRHPDESVILTSYAAELAEANSRRARGHLLDPSWPFPGVSVSAESAAVNRWHTTRRGGVIAAGVRGGLTGHGANLLVVDDPVKDREEADSEAIRNSTWAWWTEVATTRLMPDAVVLLVQTRWHEDDLAGRILASPSASEWTVLSLPALAEEDDPLGREEGEALWGDWYPKRRLEALRIELGERAFASLYQQRPSPEKGGVFQRAWLEGRYEKLPGGPPPRVVQALDASFKSGASNDYSAIATVAADGRYFYVLNMWRAKVEYPELLAAVKRQATEWHPEAILIEDAASGQSAIQSLRRDTALPVVPIKVAGASKVSRAEAVSPLFESGRVLFPEQSPAWLGVLIEELASFPSGRHDDQVDALGMALERLRRHGGSGSAEMGWERDTIRDHPGVGSAPLGYDSIL